jgi:hypothetical protein
MAGSLLLQETKKRERERVAAISASRANHARFLLLKLGIH